ncbi:MAG: hypothetical protein ACFE0Q_01760 [Anaerolineae bacterium]
MTRNTWRNIFIGIILLTIPCYLFGIGVYLYQGNSPAETATPLTPATRTPINLTELALTNPALIVTDIVPTVTPFPTLSGLDLTPIVPTTGGGFTPILPTSGGGSVPTNTQPAPTQVPTNTPVVNTPVPANTVTPTATDEILMPPTDTPAP